MTVDFKPTPDAGNLIEPAEIARVGVIGGGQMGNGIAHVCALAGLPVVLLDIKAHALTKAMATMARNMERQVSRSVTTSTDYEALGEADLVIEAATEKEDIKRVIFKTLTPNLKPSCIVATNTSS